MTGYTILILGIARSGTSALAGTLAHMGVPFGSNLKPIDSQNLKGNYEDLFLSKANQRILKALGSSWSDHDPLQEGWLSHRVTLEEESKIIHILSKNFLHYPIFGLKDPRLVPLFPLYERLFKKLNRKLIIFSTYRKQEEVLESILNSGYYHGSFTYEKGRLLYNHYTSRIRDILASHLGVEISFHELLYDTKKTVRKIKDSLPLEVRTLILSRKIEYIPFVDTSLHHFKA